MEPLVRLLVREHGRIPDVELYTVRNITAVVVVVKLHNPRSLHCDQPTDAPHGAHLPRTPFQPAAMVPSDVASAKTELPFIRESLMSVVMGYTFAYAFAVHGYWLKSVYWHLLNPVRVLRKQRSQSRLGS